MKVLSGIEISAQIEHILADQVLELKKQSIDPCLSVIIVGDDPASHAYVGRKRKMCEKLGIKSVHKELSKDAKPAELFKIVDELNTDPTVHGILCQSPLPKQFDENDIINAIDPLKDVDCFHPLNVGYLTTGFPRFMPCTPFGVIQLIKRSNIEIAGKNIVILGRSNIVGRPLSILLSLKGYDATVTVCHSRTKNLEAICQEADILIAAIGKPKFVTASMVKKGATVIDVGINRVDADNKRGFALVGDVDYDQIQSTAAAATPVPGGAGPMTIIMLMYNALNAARIRNNLELFHL